MKWRNGLVFNLVVIAVVLAFAWQPASAEQVLRVGMLVSGKSIPYQAAEKLAAYVKEKTRRHTGQPRGYTRS